MLRKKVSAYSSPSSETLPMDISDDRTNQKVYSGTDIDGKGRPRRRVEEWDRHLRERWNLENLNYGYKSGRATVLKVIEPVNGLLQKVADYRTYCLVKQPARYIEDIGHEFHLMAKRTPVKMKNRAFYGEDPM